MNSSTNTIKMKNFYQKNIFFKHQVAGLLTLAILLTSTGLVAQTFPTPTGFTLPNGKTIVITYEVTVDADACPVGTVPPANISNQASVSGSNFATVLTDEVAGAPVTPTLTPFAGLTLGNLVYNDLDRNGLFNGADVGINGVVLNLYLDNGDNVLTVADGAALATATTAGGGLYSFDVCPGSYLVEVAASNFLSGGALFNAGAPFVSSPVGGAGDPDNNVDNDDNGDPVSGFGVASQAITLAASNSTLDIGFKTPTTVTIADNAITEGTGGSTTLNFTVSRNDNSEAFSLTVNTTGGTATSGTDFTAISGGTVSFTAGGSMTATISVTITTDNIVEANENFTVMLSVPPPGVFITDDTATGTINDDDTAVVTLSGGTAQNEGNAGPTAYTFTATLNNPVQGGFQANYQTNNGTATTADNDYTDNDGGLTFAGTAGETQSFTVNVTGDTKVEANETFQTEIVSLSLLSVPPASVTIAGSPQAATINNDDSATLTLSGGIAQNEGNAGPTAYTFTATLSAAVQGGFQANYQTNNGTATTADNDYTDNDGGLTFTGTAGEMKSFTVNVNGDTKVEANETFQTEIVSLTLISVPPASITIAGSPQTGTITNDDAATVTLSQLGGSPNEGNGSNTTRTFRSTLNNAVQGGFHLAYTTNDGSATTADNDYVDNDGTLMFAGTANEIKDVVVTVNGDFKVENNETFTFLLGAFSNAPPGAPLSIAGTNPATGTIANDEVDYGDAPTAAQSGFTHTYKTTLPDTAAFHNALFGIHLGATMDGEANGQPTANADGDGADEDGVTLPAQFIAGTTASITVNASTAGFIHGWIDWGRNGHWNFANEMVLSNQPVVAGANVFSVSVPAGASVGTSFARFRFRTASGGLPPASANIAADGEVEDYQVQIITTSLSINDVAQVETNAGTTTFTFTASLNNPAPAGGVTFDIATQDNTATTANNDYVLKSLTGQSIPAGNTDYTFNVTVNGDNVVELNETFFVNITNVVGAGLSDGQGLGTITNDETAVVSITADVTQPEANSPQVFSVTLSNVVDVPVTVQFTTADGTATLADNDYNLVNQTVTFPALSTTTQMVNVTINNNATPEPAETFTVNLGSLSAGGRSVTIGTGTRTGTIQNDDGTTVPANGSATVACPALATAPTTPLVYDCFGNLIIPTGPVVVNAPDPLTCEGTRTYTYTYTGCPNGTQQWSFVYTVERLDFTVPANGVLTVACPALATQPTPPLVADNCGLMLDPTGPVVVNLPDPLTCEGTRTYTWTYTDCEGNTHDWSFTYTIERLDFTVPADGAATVACPSLATQPTPPTVQSDCGETITPTGPAIVNLPDPLTCEGTRTYTWTYTDCEGNSHPWSFVYTIERLDFTVPADGAATVACPSLATQPTPPTVQSNCGETLTPTGPVVVNLPDPLACEGTRTYTWTYTDCEGNSHDWSFVYTVERLDFTVPADGAATVSCPAQATQPTPPTVQSNCGETLVPTGPVVVNNPEPIPCAGGTRTYTWTYTDCEGNSHPWSFVYTIVPVPFSVPADGAATVACPALATQPTPPIVNDACGNPTTPTGPVVVNNPDPIACEGTRTYTWTYMDCAGNMTPWNFVYTIERLPFSVPANGAATVACPALATTPTPPVVLGNCGETLPTPSPVVTDNPAPLACEGTRTYAYTYVDCEGNTATWSFVYTIERNDFTINTPNGSATVACPALATAPVPPVVLSDCGETITPTGPAIVNLPDPLTCEGTRTYTWTYTDCEGNSHPWSFTYTIERLDFSVPANGAATVACPALATQPVPPVVLSNCGEVITPTGPVIVNVPDPLTCEGTRTYQWTYTDCEGNSHPWSFTYTVERLDFTVPANGAATVACPALATQPVPPVVLSNCGEVITPTGPVIVNVPNPLTCEGTRTYQWTYTDCEGNSHPWSFVYTVERLPFTVPANGAATVACPALATQPIPPTVTSNCGEILTPTGPVIVNVPNPITCEGTRTYTWIYTDCEGNTAQWSFVYTVERQPFSVPANGGATVDCPDDTDVTPTPPVVLSNCGEVLTPVLFNVTPKNDCEGHRKYTFRYTDCEGNFADWAFIYLVEYLDFTVPPSVTETVECPLNEGIPVPPVVQDNCGYLLNPTGPVITSTTNPWGCAGSRTYTWTYKDCEGNTHDWSYTYIFAYTADFFAPADEVFPVSCVLYAVAPFPPDVYDICGNLIPVSGPVMTEEMGEGGCSGIRTFTFTYTDCGGHSDDWVYTYLINDDIAPQGTCADVDVTDLGCIEEVPCPETFDFTVQIQKLLNAGNIYDVCSGTDLVVTLDSWTELWQCSDPDADGVYTFGRTFYFRIADQCGNEFPEVCSITYSGECQPITTFPQGDWGLPGEGGNPDIDLGVIQTLLNNYGPLTVGGGNRSLTLTQAQCVADLLPGTGGPDVLGNCHQLNCTGCNQMGLGGLKNVLAANAIALTLNIRYNVEYNGLTFSAVRNQGLDCIAMHPTITNIRYCPDNGSCVFRVFDINGNQYTYPYTIGGLLDLTNYFLGGNLALSGGASGVYATALNEAVKRANGYWNDGEIDIACDPGAGAAPTEGSAGKSLPDGHAKPDVAAGFGLAPNPAGKEVTFTLAQMDVAQEVTLEIYNPLGQLVLRKEFGLVRYLEERIDLGGFGNGLYVVSVKAGQQRFEQKLVIGND